MPPETCPNCDALVPRQAACCPECGADENTGWSESAQADRLGIPDENFDYDRYVSEEFSTPQKPRGVHWVWWLTALLLTGLFLFYWFR